MQISRLADPTSSGDEFGRIYTVYYESDHFLFTNSLDWCFTSTSGPV